MNSAPDIINAIHDLSSEQMIFITALTAILVVGAIAYLALGGGRGDHA